MFSESMTHDATSRCPFSHASSASETLSSEPVLDEFALAESISAEPSGGSRTGVLLVNHGSHSPNWRKMLLDVHANVKDELLAIPGIDDVRTAFMEYTEPSIATQLRAFDEDSFDRVILVPLLLTVSNHSFDDIPVIYGEKDDPAVIAELENEKIERYAPEASVEMTPLLDYPKLVHRNIARRVRSLQQTHAPATNEALCDGVVLVGYGSAEFNDEWEACFGELCDVAQRTLQLAAAEYAWCGHLVRYSRQPTSDAIKRVLGAADRVIVVPILVACDEMFQDRIIGGAVKQVAEPGRVLYAADSILPEPAVADWIVNIVRQSMAEAVDNAKATFKIANA